MRLALVAAGVRILRSAPAVASRDRVGPPRCDRCPDLDERDPLAVLTGIITGLDPSLPADAIPSAAQRLFARRGNLRRRLVWAIEPRPSLLI